MLGQADLIGALLCVFIASVFHESQGHAEPPGPANLVPETNIAPIDWARSPQSESIPVPTHKGFMLPPPMASPPILQVKPPNIGHERTTLPENAPSPSSRLHKRSRMAPSPTGNRIHHNRVGAGLSPTVMPKPSETPAFHANSSTSPRSFHNPSPRTAFQALAPAPLSSSTFHWPHPKARVPAPMNGYSFGPPYHHQAAAPRHSQFPLVLPKSRRSHHGTHEGSPSPIWSPMPPKIRKRAPAPLPASFRPRFPPRQTIPPSGSLPRKPRELVPSSGHVLPPPPPNEDCTPLACSEPLTNTLPGSPCGCVLPMQVGLRLSVALYTFFPLVSELAEEIAAGVFMKQSQVRIMGANAANQQPDKTVVLIDLVPLGEKFENTTAFFTYKNFWLKKVAIKGNFFGSYEVLYVHYPGLPPPPPMAPSDISIDDSPFFSDNNGRAIKPLGVDLRKEKRDKLGGSLIAIIVLSSVIAFMVLLGASWFLFLKCRHSAHERLPISGAPLPPGKTLVGGGGSLALGSGPSSASLSLRSNIAPYTGSAKTFSVADIEMATNNFDDSRVLGEGGFGRVYRGILEDGSEVAVKILKRDDQQGSREFLAEVEMLSRLHHRNLVKLIGICTVEHNRCLVYELIPNGSVESHLHGVDKEAAPLDWDARMKIALGSARGLAYLHEDSSPRVIHRDFKASNILLEHDFTPKVSDFGLARTALDEGHEHISTRVMGTFGYVAPEYAMTGHLLVKSDVYSYGVVLLELLTGRKPVDMSQPPGQENLVTWARPLLTSKEGLEKIIDPALGTALSFDSVAKVAAIASMCVQPEVSHRPFMGEVVQALKLVCNENEEKKEEAESCGQEDLMGHDSESRVNIGSGMIRENQPSLSADYYAGLEGERPLSAADMFSISTRLVRQGSGSFRRHSNSAPLRTERNRNFWWRSFSRGTISEHGIALKFWQRVSESGRRWP